MKQLGILVTSFGAALVAVTTAASCDDSAVPAAPAADAATEAEPEDTGAPVDVPCPASGVSKGPWSLAMTRTGGKVRWEACRGDSTSGIVLTLEAGGGETAVPSTSTPAVITKRRTAPLNPVAAPDDAPGTYYTHEAVLTGLTPGACYRYALAADRTLGGRFCASQPDGAKVHFLMIGDTNPQVGPATGNVLGQTLKRTPDFVMHGGDVQYYDSKVETWNGWFPIMRPMLAQGAFMVSLGNHELELEGEDFDDYYMRYFGDASLGGRDAYFHFESGGVHFLSLSTEHDLALGSPQNDWIEATLDRVEAEPGFRFAVIYLHRPFYSVGDYGIRAEQRDTVEPIVEAHRIPLVLAGHMHAYERFVVPYGTGPEAFEVTYVTTGGGGFRISPDALNDHVAEHPEDALLRVASHNYIQAMQFEITRATDGTDRIRGLCADDMGMERDAFEVTCTLVPGAGPRCSAE